MSECFYTAITESPDFMLGILAGLLLQFVIKGLGFIVERLNVIIQPLIIELCMLGNLRLRIFGMNFVFINPLLARQVRQRLKTI